MRKMKTVKYDYVCVFHHDFIIVWIFQRNIYPTPSRTSPPSPNFLYQFFFNFMVDFGRGGKNIRFSATFEGLAPPTTQSDENVGFATAGSTFNSL